MVSTGADALPLAGVRVADFSRVLAGPYASMMLADFGADVIKIESPLGDETRAWMPPVGPDGTSTYFGAVNRNKRSIVCDFTVARDLAVAERLAATADVVIENFRPGSLRAFGLDFDGVSRSNPDVVYCSITGFGAASSLPGYDLLVQAVGGLMSITGQPDGEPTKVGVALVDVITGQNALAGILLALRTRDARAAGGLEPRAELVEVNLLQSALSALTNQAASTLATGSAPARTGNAHPSIAPYEVYRAADRELVIAVGTDAKFRSLCVALGAPELAHDPRFATNSGRVADRVALAEAINARLSTEPAATWVRVLGEAGIPVGTINSIAEAFALAADLGLDTRVELDGSASVANPIGLASSPAEYRSRAPRLGDDEPLWRDERPTHGG